MMEPTLNENITKTFFSVKKRKTKPCYCDHFIDVDDLTWGIQSKTGDAISIFASYTNEGHFPLEKETSDIIFHIKNPTEYGKKVYVKEEHSFLTSGTVFLRVDGIGARDYFWPDLIRPKWIEKKLMEDRLIDVFNCLYEQLDNYLNHNNNRTGYGD